MSQKDYTMYFSLNMNARFIHMRKIVYLSISINILLTDDVTYVRGSVVLFILFASRGPT